MSPCYLKGEECPNSKLTAEQVKQIRRLLAMGLSQKRIGEKFGTDATNVSAIKRGHTWKEA